jgi:hypothetical protein
MMAAKFARIVLIMEPTDRRPTNPCGLVGRWLDSQQLGSPEHRGKNKRQRQMTTDNQQTHTIARDGLPPIRFTGELIGHGSTKTVRGSNQNRWTEAAIYRTKGGKYVVALERHSQWEGERNCYTAASCATAQEVITWLGEGETTLGEASEEAVVAATKADDNFKAAWIEEVE